MTSVFISYSRTDRDFVKLLRTALEHTHHDAWVDLTDIPPSADWAREISTGIDGADNFVCVLSPEWLASQTCQMELARAVEAHKRIIPLLRRDVHVAELPPPVRAANWIFFRPGDDGDAALRQLLFAIDTDLDYWHLASRMQVRAVEWEQKREHTSFTLRGKELAEAERWLAQGADKQPSPTALQTRYITASRRTSARRQRTIITALSAFLAITVVLATLASIQTVRVSQQNTQLTSDNSRLFARALAGESSASLVSREFGEALLLGDAATQRQDTFDTRNALLDALESSSHLGATVRDVEPGVPYEGPVVAVSFSADGKTLMYAESFRPGRITLWDTTTRHPRVQYTVNDTLYGSALSPDGTLLATLGLTHGLILRHAATGDQIALLAPQAGQEPGNNAGFGNLPLADTNVAFSRDGNRLAAVLCDTLSCAHPSIGVWNARTGAFEANLRLEFVPIITSLAFNPSGHAIAATECNYFASTQVCQIERWDLFASGASLRFKHVTTAADGAPPYNVESVAFSPDGSRLYTGSCVTVDCSGEQSRILIWDATTGTRVANTAPVVSPTSDVARIVFSPDGRTFVTTDSSGNVVLWDAATLQPMGAPLAGHEGDALAVAFSPDSHTFATADISGKALLWRIARFTSQSILPGPDLDTSSELAYSPDGKLLATANCDSVVRLWDPATGKLLRRLSAPGFDPGCLDSLAFSPNSQLLATSGDDGSTAVWDLVNGDLASVCTQCGTTSVLRSGTSVQIAFSPDNRLMALPAQNAAGNQVALASATTGKLYHMFTNPGVLRVPGVAFSPDGRMVAVGGGGQDNSSITLWDLAQQTTVAVLRGAAVEAAALAFTHDGRHLIALGFDGVLTVWDIASHKAVSTLNLQHDNTLEMSLSLHPNGWLLAVSADQAIWLVDLRDLAHPQLYVHALTEPGYVLNVAFSPDGKRLAAAEDGYGVVVRLATLGEWQQQACAEANRNFSHAEWRQYFGSQGLPYTSICPGLLIPA